MRSNALVQCLNDAGWQDEQLTLPVDGPVFKGIYTVVHNNSGYLILEEFPHMGWDGMVSEWNAYFFREIQPPMTIDISEIQHQTQTV